MSSLRATKSLQDSIETEVNNQFKMNTDWISAYEKSTVEWLKTSKSGAAGTYMNVSMMLLSVFLAMYLTVA